MCVNTCIVSVLWRLIAPIEKIDEMPLNFDLTPRPHGLMLDSLCCCFRLFWFLVQVSTFPSFGKRGFDQEITAIRQSELKRSGWWDGVYVESSLDVCFRLLLENWSWSMVSI